MSGQRLCCSTIEKIFKNLHFLFFPHFLWILIVFKCRRRYFREFQFSQSRFFRASTADNLFIVLIILLKTVAISYFVVKSFRRRKSGVIQTVGAVEPIIAEEAFCSYCLAIFDERINFLGSTQKVQNLEQLSVAKREWDKLFSLIYNNWLKVSFMNKNG